MPDLVQADITTLIEETRRSFRVLDAWEHDIQRIEAGTYKYRDYIPKILANQIDDNDASKDGRVVLIDRSLTQDRNKLRAAIDWPLRFQVHLGRGGDATKADLFDAYFSHAMRRMDPRGQIFGRVYDNIVDHRFGCLYATASDAPEPRKGEEDADYEKRVAHHWRHAIRSVAPDSVGFLDYQGDPTVCAIEEELGFIELIDTYGDRAKNRDLWNNGNYGQLMLEQFPHIRLQDGRGVDSASEKTLLSSKITRCIFDDGHKIRHYVKEGPNDTDQLYQLDGQEYPNTFGRPSLFVFTGIYRGDAPEDLIRWEGLLGPLAQVTRDIVLCRSIIATAQANPKVVEQEVPPQAQSIANIAREAGIKSVEELASVDFSKMPRVDGSVQHWVDDVVEGFSTMLSELKEMREDMRSSLALLYPDAQTAEQATLGAILFGAGGALREYKGPNASIQTNVEQLCVAIAHDIVSASAGDGDDIEWQMFGDETYRGELKDGKLSAADFDVFPHGGSITVRQVAETDAQRAAAGRQELMAMSQGVSNPRRYYEAIGEPDVAARIQEQLTWDFAQNQEPATAARAIKRAIEVGAARQKQPVEQYIAEYAPQFIPPGEQKGIGDSPDSAGYSYNTPVVDAPGDLPG